MSWLIETSLRLRVLVVALAIALIVVGIRTSDEVPLDVFPEFAPPVVEIQTEVPGISTEEVEGLVTVPIENALNGVPFVKTVRSKSVLGLSSVRLIFATGTDLIMARQLVQEQLATVATTLPAVSRPPRILPPLSSLSRCLKIGFWKEVGTEPQVASSTEHQIDPHVQSQMDMTVVARWTLRPRLMAVSGVANVAIWREKDPQLQVAVDPDRLRAHGVTLDMLLQTVRDATAVGSGGFIDTANQRLAIRHIPTVYSPAGLSKVVVTFRNGAPLRIRDVANVVIDVENTIRRLRRNLHSDQPQSAFQVVLAASMEVRSAVVYATLIVIFAFLPVFFFDGLAGSFFRPLATSYILAILASLVVALTITPALSLLLLPSVAERCHRDAPLVIVSKRMYSAILRPLVQRPKATLGVGLTLLGGLGAFIPMLGEELMPKFKETDFLMHWVEKPGIGIDAMNRIAIRASEEMMAVPGVINFGSHIGRAEVADISVVPAPNTIQREGASRRIDVTCNVEGRDLGSVAREIERVVLANVAFPTEYHPEFLGEYAEAQASRQRMLAFVILGGIVTSTLLNLFLLPIAYGQCGSPSR